MKRSTFLNLLISILFTFAIIAGCGGSSSKDSGSTSGAESVSAPPDADKDGIEDSLDNCPNLANASQVDIDCDGAGDACTAPDTTDADCDFIYDGCDDNIDLADVDCDGEADSCIRPDLTDEDCDGVVDGCETEVCTEDPCSENCVNNPDDCIILLDGDCDGISDDCDDSFDDVDKDCDDLGDTCSDDVVDDTNSDGDDIFDGCDNCPVDDNPDQIDSDCDGIGDLCDLVNDSSDDDLDGISNGCDPDYPELLPASLLTVESGCVTYIGAHPLYPDSGEVQTYRFCFDGTVTKYWNPDPNASMPGDLTCEGTWSYDENVLTIDTTDVSYGMNSVEIYGNAYMYDDGAKLDFFSTAKVPSGDKSTVKGDYALDSLITVDMGTMMDMDTTTNTSLVVTDSDPDDGLVEWVSELTVTVSCAGMACGSITNGTQVTNESGILATPVSLYDLNNGTYIFQTTDELVLEKQ